MAKQWVQVEQRVLSKNDAVAATLRQRFAEAGVFVVNIMSSPGAGKTTLLAETLRQLDGRARLGVVVGDLATDNDARRLMVGAHRVRQITTGTVCHLEATMVEHALADWPLAELDILFIENVGNLVCPADFDLGEAVRVVLFATTEGEDKPVKYPPILLRADLVVLSKVDLVPALAFSVDAFRESVKRVRPGIPILSVSARTGQGLDEWVDWLMRAREHYQQTITHADARKASQA